MLPPLIAKHLYETSTLLVFLSLETEKVSREAGVDPGAQTDLSLVNNRVLKRGTCEAGGLGLNEI